MGDQTNEEQKIERWMSNRVATQNTRLPKGFKTVWTAREVFAEKNKTAISELRDQILAETGGGANARIAAWNQAKARLWGNLTEEEVEEYEEVADQWTLDGPDADLRAE